MPVSQQDLQSLFLQSVRQTRQYFMNKKHWQPNKQSDSQKINPSYQTPSIDLSISRSRIRQDSSSAAVAGAIKLLKTKICQQQQEIISLKNTIQMILKMNEQLKIQNTKMKNQIQWQRIQQIDSLKKKLNQTQNQWYRQKQKYSKNMLDYITQINGLKERIQDLANPQNMQRINRCSIDILQQKVADLQKAILLKSNKIIQLQNFIQSNRNQHLSPKYLDQPKVSVSYKLLLEEVINRTIRLSHGQPDIQEYIKGAQNRMYKLNDTTYKDQSPLRKIDRSPASIADKSKSKSKSKTRSRPTREFTSKKNGKRKDSEQSQLQYQLAQLKQQYFKLSQSKDPQAQLRSTQLIFKIQQKTQAYLLGRKKQ